jgi:hypothetical protein
LRVVDSTVRNNSVNEKSSSLGASGGGLNALLAEVTIERSTFNDNFAAWNGGGMWTHNSSTSARTTIVHATFYENTATEGGGIYATGPVPAEVSSSIVAFNFGRPGPDCGGNPESGGYNLLRTGLDCPLIDDGTTLSGLELELQFLFDWGGHTWTHKLGEGSFAIDGAFNSLTKHDQRGESRSFGDTKDIGAFESTEFGGTRPDLPEPVATATPTPRPTATPRPAPTATPMPTATPTPVPAGFEPLLLTADTRTANPGGTVRIPILLAGAVDLGNLEFDITYDANAIELTNALSGSLLDMAGLLLDTDTSGVLAFKVEAPNGLTGSGSLIYLVFTAIGSEGSSSPLTFSAPVSIKVEDSSGSPLDLKTIDGLVRVQTKTLGGDFNGDNKITEVDVVRALQMAFGLIDEDLFLDVDKDGSVTVSDARLILKGAVSGG